MTNDRNRRDPRDPAPAPPVRPEAGGRAKLPSGGWTVAPGMMDDDAGPAAVPATLANVPLASPTEVSTEGDWVSDEVELEGEDLFGDSPSGPRPLPGAVNAAELSGIGASGILRPAADRSESAARLDLGSLASSMRTVGRPAQRPAPPRVSSDPLGEHLRSTEAPRPGMAPTPRTPIYDLPAEDRGVAVTLPPSLSHVVRSTSRPGNAVRPPVADHDFSNVLEDAAHTTQGAWSGVSAAGSANPDQPSGPWAARSAPPADESSRGLSELPLSPETLRPVDGSKDVGDFILEDAEMVADDEPEEYLSAELFDEPENEPAFGIDPVDAPLSFLREGGAPSSPKIPTDRIKRFAAPNGSKAHDADLNLVPGTLESEAPGARQPTGASSLAVTMPPPGVLNAPRSDWERIDSEPGRVQDSPTPYFPTSNTVAGPVAPMPGEPDAAGKMTFAMPRKGGFASLNDDDFVPNSDFESAASTRASVDIVQEAMAASDDSLFEAPDAGRVRDEAAASATPVPVTPSMRSEGTWAQAVPAPAIVLSSTRIELLAPVESQRETREVAATPVEIAPIPQTESLDTNGGANVTVDMPTVSSPTDPDVTVLPGELSLLPGDETNLKEKSASEAELASTVEAAAEIAEAAVVGATGDLEVAAAPVAATELEEVPVVDLATEAAESSPAVVFAPEAVDSGPLADESHAIHVATEEDPAAEPAWAETPAASPAAEPAAAPEHEAATTFATPQLIAVRRRTMTSAAHVAVGSGPTLPDGFVRMELPVVEPVRASLHLEPAVQQNAAAWTSDRSAFESMTSSLRRAQRWSALAAVLAHALEHAPHARGAARPALLRELALVARDRLADEDLATESFRELLTLEPDDDDACNHLLVAWEARDDVRAVVLLQLFRIPSLPAGNERVVATAEAVEDAQQRLQDNDLAVAAWAQLASLEPGHERAMRELGQLYRQSSRHFGALESLLRTQASQATGAARVTLLRELAALQLRGLQSASAGCATLHEILADSPHDLPSLILLVEQHGATGDAQALASLRLDGGNTAEWIAVRRQAADELWRLGEHDAAARWWLFEGVEATLPDETVERLDAWRWRTGRHRERVDVLTARAASAPRPELAARWLERAANIAEEDLHDHSLAISLVEQANTISGDDHGRLSRLRALYAASGQTDALLGCLRRLNALRLTPAQRVDVLMQQAEVSLAPGGDVTDAQLALLALLTLDAGNHYASELLVTSLLATGQVADAVSALRQRLLRSRERDASAALLERIARTLVAASDADPAQLVRSLQDWLQYAPDAADALEALKSHAASNGQPRLHAAMLERIWKNAAPERALEYLAELATAREAAGEVADAVVACERVLFVRPDDAASLERVVRLYAASGEADRAILAIERAASVQTNADARRSLLERALSLVPGDQTRRQWRYQRRIALLQSSPLSSLRTLVAAAVAAGAVDELTVVLRELMARTPAGPARLEVAQTLAGIYQTSLGDQIRAFRTLATQLHDTPPRADLLPNLQTLALEPAQLDEYLHLLELRCQHGVDPAEVRERIVARAELLAGRGSHPKLAFFELRRLLDINPADADALQRLESLAREHDLLPDLDDALQEVADRADAEAHRQIIRRLATSPTPMSGRERHNRRLMNVFVNGWNKNSLVELSGDADLLDAWVWIGCLLEARAWTSESNTLADLATVADVLATQAERPDRAFELIRWVHCTDASQTQFDGKFASLAERTGRQAERRDALRTAALTRGLAPERARDLLSAALESALVQQAPELLSIHRQVLELESDNLDSLHALLSAARMDGRAWDQRELLMKVQSQVTDTAEQIALLAEAAAVSRDTLRDNATAMALFRQALGLDASREELRLAWRQLAEADATEDTRIQLLRDDLSKAQGDDGHELRSQLLELLAGSGRQDERLELLQQAVSAGTPGAEAAYRDALREEGRHAELLQLLVSRAEADTDGAAAAALWGDAWALLARSGVSVEPTLHEKVLRGALAAGGDRVALLASLSRLLRTQERYEELRQVLFERVDSEPAATRAPLLRQIARIDQHWLGDSDGATDIWLQILSEDENDGSSLLALATLTEDAARRWEWRAQFARLLPARDAAMFLCGLAELADDLNLNRDRIPDLYREARRLDPWCAPAAEALKGISRRLGKLRPAAALLNDENEASLSSAHRSSRLLELARQADTGSEAARDLFRRALALDPDNVDAWRGAAGAAKAAGETSEASRLLQQAVYAWNRTHAPDGDAKGVELLWQAAELSRESGDTATYQLLCAEIFDQDPSMVAASMAVATAWADNGAPATALALLEPLLANSAETNAALLSFAGDLASAAGDAERALAWRSRALAERPLLSAALESVAIERARAGMPAAAVNFAAASLVAQTDAAHHADTLCRMAEWLDEGSLGYADEALSCLEEAFAWGCRRRDILERLHNHYRTRPAGARGEEIVEALLENETDEERRRTLSLALARIRASRPGDEARARVALEAALRSHPQSVEVRRLLVTVLERQQDLPALSRVLRDLAHHCDAQEAGRIWMQLAEIARQSGESAAAVVELLVRSADAYATMEALELLEAHYAEHEPNGRARLQNLARLSAVSDRPYHYALEVGRQLLDRHPRQAWCILSSLMMVRQGEDELRARLREMRRDYERPPVLVAAAAARRNLFPQNTPGHAVAMLDALRLIENEVAIGARSAAELGAQDVFEVSLHSSIGRTYASLADAMGLGGATLHRANTLPEPCMVWMRGRNIDVVLRSDIFQSIARAEVGFVLVSALELAQPGGRVLASIGGERRKGVIPAIRQALDLPTGSLVDPEVSSIIESLSDDTRDAVTALLTPFSAIDDETMLQDAFRALHGRARAAGLVAGADLYQVSRVLGRMAGDGERSGAFANASAIDDMMRTWDELRQLTAFAASPVFGEMLSNSPEIGG